MKRLLGILLVVLSATVAHAKKDVRMEMHEILYQMQVLRPYMVDQDKFNDPKNAGKITEHLETLSTHVKKLKHGEIANAPGLKFSQKVLQEHVNDTARVFKLGNKDYARWSLNSTFSICMSCHTQAPSDSRNWSLIGFTKFGSEYDHAEFLFAARDFEHALEKFDNLINGFPDNGLKELDLEKVVARKVAIFARVKRDFKAGMTSLIQSQKNKSIPPHIAKNLAAWEATFREAMNSSYPNPKTATDTEIKSYVEREMKTGLWDKMIQASNPRLVTNMTVSGVLYEYLNLHPKTELRPEILYWLSQCDRSLNNNFFFSLSDIYLKECIQQHSNHPVAKKCFDDYEASTIVSYSGSGGVHLPREVRKELDILRIKVYGAAKK